MDMKKRISVAICRFNEGVKIVEEGYFSIEDTFCFASFLHYELEAARPRWIDDDDADDSSSAQPERVPVLLHVAFRANFVR